MKSLLAVGGLVAALAIGAVAVAGAQEGTPTPEATPEASTGSGGANEDDVAGTERGAVRDDFLDRLAENLDVSREDLDGAIDETQLELIDQALADGKIDEEEAATLRERVESGDALFPFLGGGRIHHFRHAVVSFVDLAADILGLDNEELVEQLRDDQSLADVAGAQGVDVEQFKTDLLAAAKAKLDAEVAEGDLEQERADEIYARFSENIDDIVNKTHEDRPFRGRPHIFEDGPLSGAIPFPEDGAIFEGDVFEGIPDFGFVEEELSIGA